MRKYLSFFRIRFINGLQYRAAAYAGIATQFAWGFMEIIVYNAFLRTNQAAFPLEIGQLNSYIWMRQALLGLFMTWYFDGEIFEMIKNGNVAYELCRPCGIYEIWFTKNLAVRASRCALRCLPILLVASLLPESLRMYPPASLSTLLFFLLSCAVGLFVTVGLSMFIYAASFYTISPIGLRIVAVNVMDFCSGAIIPLPFYPPALQKILFLLPFASMESTPFLIYSGALTGSDTVKALSLQLFWCFVILLSGKLFLSHSVKSVVIQGG